jgi:hypothetical protein
MICKSGISSGGMMTIKLSPDQEKMLLLMAPRSYDDCFYPFAAWQRSSGIDPHKVRRIVRELACKKLVHYMRSLMSEDGAFLGAGYGLTAAGVAYAAERGIETNGTNF